MGLERVSHKLCLIDGAGHENCGSIGKVEYRKFFDEFVAACLNRIPQNGDIPLNP